MRSREIRALALFSLAVFAACGGSSDSATINTGAVGSTAAPARIVFLQTEGEVFISGVVFNDVDGSGVMDTCEPGIEGVLVQLKDAANTVILNAAITAEGGAYAFAVSPGQSYWITANDPPGYSSFLNSFPLGTVEGNVALNFALDTIDPSYSICGMVYYDADGDGDPAPEEPGMSNVAVTLSGVGDVMTDAEGYYAFAVTTKGPYTVGVTEPEGYTSTTENPVSFEVSGYSVLVDFGLWDGEYVYVDIKPCNEVNPVNLKSQGVLPTAILGSGEFNVESIDPGTILLEGVAPARANIGYVCGDEECGEGETGDDGFLDLLLKFDTSAIAETLIAQYPDLARGDIVPLDFRGALHDGTALAADPPISILIVQVPKE